MLQFGASSGAKGIGVEQTNLNGNNLGITGIENANSQEQTYVDHVTLYQILDLVCTSTAILRIQDLTPTSPTN